MSTFSAYGMGPKGFLVNRMLNDYEREHRFDIKKSASDKAHYDLSLIRFNSTFTECVDKWYSMRGFVAMAGSVVSALMIYLICVSSYELFFEGYQENLALLLLGAVILWWAVKFLVSDAFTYTHYPIRFNRKNRQVYAFRRDGTVFKAGWDELYWTIYNTKVGLGGGDLNVMGHLLDKEVLRHFVWNTTLTMLPWLLSPVGMCAGRWPACAHVHRAGLIRRMSPWALP